MGCVWMRLLGKFTHEKPGLLVGEPETVSSGLRPVFDKLVPTRLAYLNRFIFRRCAVRSAAV